VENKAVKVGTGENNRQRKDFHLSSFINDIVTPKKQRRKTENKMTEHGQEITDRQTNSYT